ncbi:2,3-bisphosphoglycerate-independent phosphoglycerate mutase [Brockia lithotrophica]|uniref:2,3-bisphosphoglycerate-independent phosphoglycerate mutase n=1 Tax=Brockia lithotrophica TaxID=933949 RepID=A0A660KYK7_9BACL|nr:2,3-bisphosphoglycerate-independent phosphoglycerate mutase [Brockia lithotrophica]RKQ85444.1 phosphoglycerate mutase [Brockia lithotrophica]
MGKGPYLLVVLDGWGIREETYGNAVALARTPNFDRYWTTYPHTLLRASGPAVGLPEGQMGNSEVGHLNLGAGRIVYQDLLRIDRAIEDGSFFEIPAFVHAVRTARDRGKNLHLMGLLSPGGVHSHMRHLFALLDLARRQGFGRVYVHAFLDGRDVLPTSGKGDVARLLEVTASLGVGTLATLIGRYYAMDRDRRWERTEQAYRAIVYGEGIPVRDPISALEEAYAAGETDEFLRPRVLVDDEGRPRVRLQDGDAVIFFNFRPDRARQLVHALVDEEFHGFDRGPGRPKDLYVVTMTEYEANLPVRVAFPPEHLVRTAGEVWAEAGLTQLRIAETEKYAHVTYFFSGGREEPFPGERRVLIPSPKVATYDLKPEMSAYEVADALLEILRKDPPDVIVLNFANPDMVGHSGKLEPTVRAVEAVDENLGRVVDAVLALGGVAFITADHGNADMVLTPEGEPFTQHTLSPVPFIVTLPGIRLREGGVLGDVVPTMLDVMGIPKPPEMTGTSLILREVGARSERE